MPRVRAVLGCTAAPYRCGIPCLGNNTPFRTAVVTSSLRGRFGAMIRRAVATGGQPQIGTQPGIARVTPVPARVEVQAAAPVPSLVVTVIDASPGGRQLMAATLYALGCHIQPFDALDGRTPCEQVAAGAPDVLVWQCGEREAVDAAQLATLLRSGVLEHTGVVITARAPTPSLWDLERSVSRVQVLVAPCRPVELMRALSEAARQTKYRGVGQR